MTNAKAIIHAVGPNFAVTPTAFKELFDAYYNSLVVLKDNGYHSISFPLISSGIFGGLLDNPVVRKRKNDGTVGCICGVLRGQIYPDVFACHAIISEVKYIDTILVGIFGGKRCR